MTGTATQEVEGSPKGGTEEGQVLGIYHLNINVTNLERSRAFYELFGFRVIELFHERGARFGTVREWAARAVV